MNPEHAAALRAPFPPEAIGKLPRKGVPQGLDYVGHAAVTDRLLAVDPEWVWEPVAYSHEGDPLIVRRDNDAVMWIRLTVAGTTRLGVGIVNASAFELEKQLVSDAIRNAAMRFGVALDLWSKEPLPDMHTEPPYDALAGWESRDAAKAAHAELGQLIGSLPDDERAAVKAACPAWPMNRTDFVAVRALFPPVPAGGDAKAGTAMPPTASDAGDGSGGEASRVAPPEPPVYADGEEPF